MRTSRTSMNDATGLMKVSIERGLYRQIDAEKVSSGAHYTESSSWLTPPVEAFIARQIEEKKLWRALDPFAGDGHLLRLMQTRFALSSVGMDLHAPGWIKNDSLLEIPCHDGALICTNPPYLAKYSARRKGVWALVEHYFESCAYEDLYLRAIDRMLASGMPTVAIVPETFISSGLLRLHLERIVVLERSNPFSTTETPVCVACFDPAYPSATTLCYKDDAYLGDLEALESSAHLAFEETARRRIRFNVTTGALALKAVDGTQAEDRIRFMPAADFAYDPGMIKESSRLMTRIHVEGLEAEQMEVLVALANQELERIRLASHDMVLSPFKGNNKNGVRRRRLDYKLARAIIAAALARIPHADQEQPTLF
jgi:hypothetical protein